MLEHPIPLQKQKVHFIGIYKQIRFCIGWLLDINNKVLLQWGRFNFTTTDYTLTFPTSYSSVNYSICLTDRWMTPSTDYVQQVVSYALITTKMTTTYCRILANAATQDTVWMSIGF